MYDVQKYDNYFKDGDFIIYRDTIYTYLCYIHNVMIRAGKMEIIYKDIETNRRIVSSSIRKTCDNARSIFKVIEFYNDDMRNSLMRGE